MVFLYFYTYSDQCATNFFDLFLVCYNASHQSPAVNPVLGYCDAM